MTRILAFLLALLPAAALGQQGVRQSGNVSPAHVACWTVSGIVQDCGVAAAPFANIFGLVGNGNNTVFFIDTNQPTQPFNQFTIGFSPTTFTFGLNALGGATHIPLTFCVNGNCPLSVGDTGLSISGGSTAGTVPTVSSGAGDCGTSPAIVGNANAGRVTVGSGTNGGQCTITFAAPFTHPPVCYAYNESEHGTANLVIPEPTTTALVIAKGVNALQPGDSLAFTCTSYN